MGRRQSFAGYQVKRFQEIVRDGIVPSLTYPLALLKFIEKANIMYLSEKQAGKTMSVPTTRPSSPSRFTRKQQERMISLLRMARVADLTRTKTAISLTKLLKLRLGDTFRFVIYHVERHILQADNVLAAQQMSA